MANDYCTVLDVKGDLPDVTSWGVTYDATLAALVTHVSRLIDRVTEREPGAYAVSADTTRYFTGSGDRCLWIGELAAAPTTVSMSLTGSVTTYTDLAATDYQLWPYNAAAEALPYLRLDLDQYNGNYYSWYTFPKAVKIVGKFGFATSAPEPIKRAAIVQCVHWFKRAQQAYADTGAIPELGQLRYTKALDPEVSLLLSAYTRLTL